MVGDLLSYVGKGYAGDMNEDYKHTKTSLPNPPKQTVRNGHWLFFMSSQA